MTGHCRKNFKGYEVWQPRLKDERPRVWNYKGERSKKWTPQEIERVFEVLSELPDVLREQAIKGLYRMKRSIFDDNPATSNLGDIVLYDSAFQGNRNLAQVIAHELAHQLYDTLPDEERDSYASSSGWSKDATTDKWSCSRKPKEYIQPDGRDSPDEDFSNNIEFFIFRPDTLRACLKRSCSAVFKRTGEDQAPLNGAKYKTVAANRETTIGK